MKGKKVLGALAIAGMAFGMTSVVNAADLTEEMKFYGEDIAQFTTSYDADSDVNKVKVTVTLTQDVIDNILAQKPGHSGVGSNALKSFFYVGIQPNITGNFKKNNQYYIKDAKTIEEMKADVDTKLDSETPTTNSSVWPFGVYAVYYKDGRWNRNRDQATGNASIGETLVADLGLNSIDELVYGENYRFEMYNEYDWMYAWKDENKTEYVLVNYELKFPIAAKMENGTEAYYPTLQQALESESTDIVVNEDLIVNEDITIPEGTTLTVDNGVTVTFAEGKKLVNNGTVAVLGNASLIVDGKVFITTDEEEPKQNETSKEETKKEEKNPNTVDNIGLYAGMATLAAAGVAVSAYKARKHN